MEVVDAIATVKTGNQGRSVERGPTGRDRPDSRSVKRPVGRPTRSAPGGAESPRGGCLSRRVVPKAGLEPARVAPHGPQPCASTNSATSAQSTSSAESSPGCCRRSRSSASDESPSASAGAPSVSWAGAVRSRGVRRLGGLDFVHHRIDAAHDGRGALLLQDADGQGRHDEEHEADRRSACAAELPLPGRRRRPGTRRRRTRTDRRPCPAAAARRGPETTKAPRGRHTARRSSRSPLWRIRSSSTVPFV